MQLILGLLVAAKITIRLVDFGDVAPRTLAAAEEIAGHVLETAGVEVTWLKCPGPSDCRGEPAEGEFRLLLLNLRPPQPRGDRMGFAVVPSDPRARYAGVFYPMVEDAARNLDADPSHLLGAGMAHEIGHLLLGSQSHSRAGIMSPTFRQEHVRLAARGELLFNPDQARRIKSRLGPRVTTRLHR